MNISSKIAAVVNPNSANGKTARRWPEVARRLEEKLGPVSTYFTERPGHGLTLSQNLLKEGYEMVIAAGGDGTMNEVANGFLENDKPVNPEARMGILPLGTGGDFRRALGVPLDLDNAIDVLASGHAAKIDMGKAVYVPSGGSPASLSTRYFVNMVSFGMGGEVAARVRNFLSPLGGKAAFQWATFKVFLGYRGKRVRLRLDGAPENSTHFITNISVGNGPYHGGGMHPCPTAVLNDGIFEVTVIDYLGMLTLIRDMKMLYSDNVYLHPKVHHLRGRRVTAEADETTCIEVDGEPLGTLPLEITLLPECLPLVVPPSSPLLNRNG